jgi:hypothetical protein
VIVVASIVLGVVFVVSGITKIAAPRSGARSLPISVCLVRCDRSAVPGAGGRRPARRPARPIVRRVVAGVMLAAFTVLLIVRLKQGRRPPCACFGALSTKPIGWGNVVRNVVFLGLAAVVALG